MGEFKFKIEKDENDFIVELGISKNGKKVNIPKKELKGDPNLIFEESVISKISEIVAKEFKWSGEVKLDLNDAIKKILQGVTVVVFDNVKKAISFDAKKVPQRSISEPENENVLNGAKDACVES